MAPLSWMPSSEEDQAGRFCRVPLIAGNILHILNSFLEQFPATRIALLPLDMDVKEPTQYALEHLYDCIVPQGLIVIGDYGSVADSTEGIDEFVQKKLKTHKNLHYKIPAYLQKSI
jgi:hypothetical protein